MNYKIPEIIYKNNLLLVEGQNEEEMFKVISETLGISEAVQIISYDGKDNFRNKLGAILDSSKSDEEIELINIGITRDANDKPNSALQSVQDALKDNGLPVPDKQLERSEGTPNTIIYLTSGKDGTGMLEDICLESVEGEIESKCMIKYFECLEKNKIIQKNASKAMTQAYLAAKEECGFGLNIAFRKGYIPLGHPAFENSKKFILSLVS